MRLTPEAENGRGFGGIDLLWRKGLCASPVEGVRIIMCFEAGPWYR